MELLKTILTLAVCVVLFAWWVHINTDEIEENLKDFENENKD